MIAIGLLFLRMLCDCFKPQQRLETEILVLRHQLNVLQQRTPRRLLRLRWVDRALFIWRTDCALMPNAHEGYVSWERAEAIRKKVSSNVLPAGITARRSMATRSSPG